MPNAATVPNTVAIAAPATSNRGKPKFPSISRKLNVIFTMVETGVVKAIFVFPLPRCAALLTS